MLTPGTLCKSKTGLVNMYSVSTGLVQITATSNHVLTSAKTNLITDETL